MLDGCFFFHDVPQRFLNIDHVVVAPTVFAIETKTRRKRIKAEDGKADYEITLKNHALKFPDYEDKSAIVQAVRNADGWRSPWPHPCQGQAHRGDTYFGFS
jgi:hypothetical protein